MRQQDVQDFMDDVRKQLDDMKKQSDEMRKLKAIIVKHENRIRALEASQKARDEDVLDANSWSNSGGSPAATAPNDQSVPKHDTSDGGGSSASPMAPDEV